MAGQTVEATKGHRQGARRSRSHAPPDSRRKQPITASGGVSSPPPTTSGVWPPSSAAYLSDSDSSACRWEFAECERLGLHLPASSPSTLRGTRQVSYLSLAERVVCPFLSSRAGPSGKCGLTHCRGVSATVLLLSVEVVRTLETLNGFIRLEAKSSAHTRSGRADRGSRAQPRTPPVSRRRSDWGRKMGASRSEGLELSP